MTECKLEVGSVVVESLGVELAIVHELGLTAMFCETFRQSTLSASLNTVLSIKS